MERREGLEWVIVEEPELGLHPDGVLAVMLLLFEVVRRGYRLVVSTHSSLVLDLLWAIRNLWEIPAREGQTKLLEILGLRRTPFTAHLVGSVLQKYHSVVYLDFDGDDGVRSHSITALDPSAPDPKMSEWGGLLRYSTRLADVLSARS
jgi:hypothetical protein